MNIETNVVEGSHLPLKYNASNLHTKIRSLILELYVRDQHHEYQSYMILFLLFLGWFGLYDPCDPDY